MRKRQIKTGAIIVFFIASILVVLLISREFLILLPEPEASPEEVIRNFAMQNKAGNYQACYYLMASDYKESTTFQEFKNRLIYCSPPWPYYRLTGIKNEVISGSKAFIEIEYTEIRKGVYLPAEPEKRTKTIELVREEEGWKLIDLNCELRD